MLPIRESHHFHYTTLLVTYNWVTKFINYKGDDYFELWFKRLDESYVGIPQDAPYKEGYTKEYNAFLALVHADDRAMFAFLCRVLVYRYAFEKGFIACKSFKITDYVNNSNSELYQTGILKLGRGLILESAPVKTEPLDVSGEIHLHLDKDNEHFKPVENYMNTLTQFANVPSTTVHLVHGKPSDTYTEQELMSLIRNARKAQNDIKDLVDTSERMKLRHEQLEEDIKVYVKVLDALPTADNNQPF